MNLTDLSSAKELSRNPLGIIALFIALVYGFACLIFGLSNQNLLPYERLPLILFIVLFPVAVLGLFGWLVSRHHNKLYAPKDYRDDESFFRSNDFGVVLDQERKGLYITEENKASFKELMAIGEGFDTVKSKEELIKKDLEEKGLDVSSESTKVLMRHLAFSQTMNWFESTYFYIYGSQIRLLKHLNERREQKVGITELQTYFDYVKGQNQDSYSNWDLNNYLKYLFDRTLIGEEDGNYYISIAGSDFLTILTKSGYSENRPL